MWRQPQFHQCFICQVFLNAILSIFLLIKNFLVHILAFSAEDGRLTENRAFAKALTDILSCPPTSIPTPVAVTFTRKQVTDFVIIYNT